MSRRMLSDREWESIKDDLPGKEGDRGVTARDNRLFIDCVLWILRTGSPWRDLPPEMGHWNSTWRRFDRWSTKGVWQRLFEKLCVEPDFEYLIIDGTIVRAHQHSAGGKGGLKIKRLAAPAVD